ncbi:kazrin isoform X2 [Labeo rohita]|uniref:Kazrin isoform X2 n=1 Tax=Labeo rohita TaxID=84645 RepID=A0A498MIA6_LABRO|nr:kazrin isoform X2 [Labeo rohita]RXN31795.1 kazrin isoform X2 [Labeo rohita]
MKVKVVEEASGELVDRLGKWQWMDVTQAVQSLNSLNDQIAHFMVSKPNTMSHEEDTFLPTERDTLSQSMALMRHLLMDAQMKKVIFG